MKTFTVIFYLINIIQLSHQNLINCTRFGLTTPYDADMRILANEVQKMVRKDNIPILADYTDTPDGQKDVSEDLTKYTESMNDQDARLTIAQLVKKYGYKFEQYSKVRTKDGYYVTLHRIPNYGKDVLFLHHGLFGSSIDWLMAKNDSLPFILAGLGYDVWLGNFRGNRYSYKHESWTPDCAQFWDFSWEEFGLYDLPASIDFITRKTNQNKVTFVGYSVSTTAFFVMTSLLPDYNDKITSMVALSPMAWMTNIQSPILKLLAFDENLQEKFKSGIGPYQYAPSDLLANSMKRVLCGNNPASQVFCSDMSLLVTGFNNKRLNINKFYAISQNYPSGGSTKTLVHYSQNVKSGQFRRYDYPEMGKNIASYKSINPPDYPIENIRAKVSFVVSYNDFLSNVTDVDKFQDMLQNVGDIVFVSDYSHVDYLWATNVKDTVYDMVVELIKKYL